MVSSVYGKMLPRLHDAFRLFDGWMGRFKFFERNFLTRRFQYGNGNVNLTTRTTRFKQDESQIRFDLVTRRVQSKMNKTEHTPTV